MSSKIIGISGVSGSGKTTLSQELGKELGATMVVWDDFDEVSEGPSDYVEWYHQGQNYDVWYYPILADVLQSLKSQHSVVHPTLKEILVPTEYIIFDTPLGRFHSQTGHLIDYSIYVDVPLDISLGRRLLRDFKGSTKTKDMLLAEIEFYLGCSRPLFCNEKLKESAHFKVDGMLSTEAQIEDIKKCLKNFWV